jgi:hypothetical protein
VGPSDGATCCLHTGHAASPRRPRAVIGRRSHTRRRPVRRTPAMPRPIPGLASTWCPSHRLNRLELSYKAGRSSPRASTEPPSSAIGALTVNSTPACFSSQTCAAPHSTRTPRSPALACCPARAAGSPDVYHHMNTIVTFFYFLKRLKRHAEFIYFHTASGCSIDFLFYVVDKTGCSVDFLVTNY